MIIWVIFFIFEPQFKKKGLTNLHEVKEAVADVDRADSDLDETAVRRFLSPGVSLGDFNLHVGLLLGQPLHDGSSLSDESKAVVALVDGEGDSLHHRGSVQAECAHMSICILAYLSAFGNKKCLVRRRQE